jgi:hypothetical protein
MMEKLVERIRQILAVAQDLPLENMAGILLQSLAEIGLVGSLPCAGFAVERDRKSGSPT